MAIWQYDLFLIGPENAPPVLTEDGWELPQFPAASTLSAQGLLVGAIGNPWLMMEDWVVFGDETGTRIDLLFDSADKVEIHIRLHASATGAELQAVCAFAHALDGQFFDPETRSLLQPDPGSVTAALAGSRAAAFSEGPRAFLSRAAGE